ncbi:MAG: hypothetical protein ACXAAO_06275 [Candidatus Thorarchaeota archaeon]|jgi:hypothetical protein
MSSDRLGSRIYALSKYDLTVKDYESSLDGVTIPHIKFDRFSYPGVEAHLFTIADAALWQPELTSSGDVILSGPKESETNESWKNLFTSMYEIMESLNQYRQGLTHGIIPTSHWVYHEVRWYRENWEGPQHEPIPAESILYLVDNSIKPHIKELNDLGFQTTQSCSGLARDHSDRESYLPYVMFDERVYPRSSAHLFTLADISGWIPSYGPHNFDVEFKLASADGAEKFWDKLIDSARDLTALLHEYQSLHV